MEINQLAIHWKAKTSKIFKLISNVTIPVYKTGWAQNCKLSNDSEKNEHYSFKLSIDFLLLWTQNLHVIAEVNQDYRTEQRTSSQNAKVPLLRTKNLATSNSCLVSQHLAQSNRYEPVNLNLYMIWYWKSNLPTPVLWKLVNMFSIFVKHCGLRPKNTAKRLKKLQTTAKDGSPYNSCSAFVITWSSAVFSTTLDSWKKIDDCCLISDVTNVQFTEQSCLKKQNDFRWREWKYFVDRTYFILLPLFKQKNGSKCLFDCLLTVTHSSRQKPKVN